MMKNDTRRIQTLFNTVYYSQYALTTIITSTIDFKSNNNNTIRKEMRVISYFTGGRRVKWTKCFCDNSLTAQYQY